MIPVTSTNIGETAVYVDTMIYNPDLVTRVDISGTVGHGSDVTVKSTPVKSGVEATAVEPAMPSAPVPSTCVGEIWLAEDSRAQQRSRNAHNEPRLPRSGFALL